MRRERKETRNGMRNTKNEREREREQKKKETKEARKASAYVEMLLKRKSRCATRRAPRP